MISTDPHRLQVTSCGQIRLAEVRDTLILCQVVPTAWGFSTHRKRGYEQLRRLQELLPKTVICRTLTATLRVNASSSLQFAGSLHLATVRRIALICNIQINVDTRDLRDVAIAVARVGLHASLSVSCISGTL